MELGNPIAQVLDQTIPAVMADSEKRPVSGFIQFARFSCEFERTQRQFLSNFLTDTANDLPQKFYYYLAYAMQLGWESGKNYVINGGVDKMLAMEDQWNKDHSPQ